MPNVIVKPSTTSSAWHVTLPEYPDSQIWSVHDTRADAEREAGLVANDFGYDGVTVLDGIDRTADRAVRRREQGYAS